MHVSITTALRYFDMVSYHPKELPEVLSIDEFKDNAGGEKYQSIVADAQNHKVIDILPNRYESDLIRYFNQFTSRMQAKCFVRLFMKTLYLIGGTMGVGKTTVCQELKKELKNSVFLDGDWCWDADPFQVTVETKAMVIRNICYMLNSFIHCSAYDNVVFC